MALTPKKMIALGRYIDHEKELTISQHPPLAEGLHAIPETAIIGNYRISFLGRVFGGFEVNIVRTDGTVITRNAKISRFIEKQFFDPVNETTVYVKLGLCNSAIIHLTAYEEPTPEDIKRFLEIN